MTEIELRQLLDFANETAWAAGRITLRYFQTGLEVERKADLTPVTLADRETEQFIRDRITARFPDHALVGEEFGESAGGAPYRWIVDPIDGTQAFVHGVPFYGVLLALEYRDQVVLGVVNCPAVGEMAWASRGNGAFWNGRRAHVSSTANAAQAIVSASGVGFRGREDSWDRLVAGTDRQRTWGDCYGYLLVATGRIDAMIDPEMKVWDCAPLLPILEEAGGSFTDWQGQRTIRGGDAIGSNGLLHDDIRRLLLP